MCFSKTELLRSALALGVLLLTGCGGGGGGTNGSGAVSISASDVIGSWDMVSTDSVDVSPYQMSLVVNDSTYTFVAPVSFPGQTACADYGTWSLSGDKLTITPIAGSSCGSSASTDTVSVSGSTMTVVSATSGTQVYRKRTAASIATDALLGTWKIMATVTGGKATATNLVASRVVLNASTYSITLPNCSESGTWSASGNALTFVPDAASTCGSSATYTEIAYLNNSLLTLNLSSTTQNIVWQKQAGTASSAPSSTLAAGTSGAINISWQLVSGATSYNVYRGTTSGSLAGKTVIGTVSSGTYVDSTAVAGTTYYYQITSVGPNGESAPSAEVSGTATATTSLVPGPVVGLTLTPGDAQIGLSWNAVSGATSYNVYYTHTSAGLIVPFHAKSLTTTPASYLPSDGWTLVPGNVTSSAATVTGLVNGDTYQFMVTPVNAYGEGLATMYVEGIPVAANPAPAPVTGLTATPGLGQVTLSWNAVSGATSYNVYSTAYGPGSIVVAPIKTVNLAGPDYYALSWFTPLQTNVTSTGTVATGLTTGATYQFVVTAVNASGEGLATVYVEAVAQ